MQRLSRDKYTTVLDPALPPAITIASGEELVVETWDAYKGVFRGQGEADVVPRGETFHPPGQTGWHPGVAMHIRPCAAF